MCTIFCIYVFINLCVVFNLQALKSCLAEVVPITDGTEGTTKWSENACTVLVDLLNTPSYSNGNLTAFVHQIDDNNLNRVILYNYTIRGKFCVNRKLITLGHATAIDLESIIFKKIEKNKTSLNTNVRTVSIKYITLLNKN